jgi:two-component system sensor histidine kinase YesM
MFEDYHLVVDRLRSVIAQLVEEREKRRQSDLTALRTQIRPHFLYNTLNSIKYLVYTGRAERISATVNSLIRILESALDVERDFVPLSEELAVIRDFIVIQEIRMDQALSVHLHVPEACRSCLVPRLSLQPLVENAVFHGIQPDPVGKAIWIRASLIEAGLSIEVIDNGRGMAEAEDELLDDGPGRSASHGLGLRNVRERLRLIYGESARMEIRSAPGSGTSVRISLPARFEESGS